MSQKNNYRRTDLKQASGNSRDYTTWMLLGIAALTIILYSGSLKNNITSFDDQDYIVFNPFLKDLSFDGIGKIFNSFYASNYHPLTTLMWMAEYNISGYNPLIYHAVNLLIHLLNILLVYRFTKLLLKENRKALFVSLLFAVHPMHVESVAWISERKDVLYTFFFLLSMIYYMRYLKEKFQLKHLILSILFFLLSLLSKSAAVILPLIVLVIDYFHKRKLDLRSAADKLPFFILGIAFGIIALYSQKVTIQADYTPDYAFSDRIFFACYAISYYLLMAIFPFHLSALHFYPDKSEGMLPSEYYLSVVIILALIYFIIRFRKKERVMVSGVLFFVAGLLIVLQLIPVGQAVVAERYTYIPYIGLFIIFSQIIFNATGGQRKVAFILASAFLIYFCITTFNRNAIWKSSLTLFRDVQSKYPDSYYANYALANAYKVEGNVSGAIKYYSISIELNPGFCDAYNNRGLLRNQMREYRGAVSDLTAAIRCDSSDCHTYFNRGMAYSNITQFDSAVIDFSTAVKLNDDFTDAYFYLGNANTNLKKYREAQKNYDIVITLDSSYGMAYANRAAVRFYLNDKDGACADWQKAVYAGFTEAEDMLKKFCEN